MTTNTPMQRYGKARPTVRAVMDTDSELPAELPRERLYVPLCLAEAWRAIHEAPLADSRTLPPYPC